MWCRLYYHGAAKQNSQPYDYLTQNFAKYVDQEVLFELDIDTANNVVVDWVHLGGGR
jgi:hypothetical protein